MANTSLLVKPPPPSVCIPIACEHGVMRTSYPPSNLPEARDCTTSNFLSMPNSPTSTHIKNPLSHRSTATDRIPLKYVTVESPVIPNPTISSGKSTSCVPNIPTTKSSKTSDRESTGKEKGLKPFWNSRCSALSDRLWLPIETGCVASHSNSSNGFWRPTEHNSWFSIREWTRVPPNMTVPSSQTTSSPSFKYSVVESMEDANTKSHHKKKIPTDTKKNPNQQMSKPKTEKQILKEIEREQKIARQIELRLQKEKEKEENRRQALVRAAKKKACRKDMSSHASTKPKKPAANCCRKIRILPDSEAATVFRQWFGCVRKTYNNALASIKEKRLQKGCMTEYWLRNRFVTACNIPKRDSYLHETTPKHVREGAIKDLMTAYKSNWTKRANDPFHTFDMKFRSRKAGEQSIVIPSGAIKLDRQKTETELSSLITIYPTYISGRVTAHTTSVKDISIDYDCRLVLDRLGNFYLHVPLFVPVESQDRTREWVALDPGVVSFMVGWSPGGSAFDIAHSDVSRLYRLCHGLDKLLKETESTKRRHRRRLERAQFRMRKRLRNLVDEVHWKTIRFLCSKFTDIVIPEFRVKDMISKTGKRMIRKKTVRQMLSWGHYRFRQRLISKAALMDVRIHVRSEEYTSKTCGRCGTIGCGNLNNRSLTCFKCGYVVGRDMNGARNIFLKNCRRIDSSEP